MMLPVYLAHSLLVRPTPHALTPPPPEVTGPLNDPCGSPHYVAPEILSRVPYGVEVDMWSVGVVCFVLLSGDMPFEEGFEISPGSGAGMKVMYHIT